MNVHFVCTGNMCRSPMAEAMLKDELERRGCDCSVTSSGTWAGHGEAATPEAVNTMREHGIDMSSHRSRPLDPAILEQADIVVAMTRVHLNEVLGVAPDVAGKLWLAKELAALPPPTGKEPGTRLRALEAARRLRRSRSLDLDDPMGLSLGAYERTVADLAPAVAWLANLVCPADESQAGTGVDV